MLNMKDEQRPISVQLFGSDLEAIKVAVELSKAFNCSVNDLPLSLVLSWYEQKAVCILLTLLYLGIENIRLGPTLPAFISLIAAAIPEYAEFDLGLKAISVTITLSGI